MYEVVVVGAGPSGIGVSIILQKMGVNFTVLDRNDVGSSFLKWPRLENEIREYECNT